MTELEIKIKVPYRIEKMFKKYQGKLLSKEIALGRILVKTLRKNYSKDEIQ